MKKAIYLSLTAALLQLSTFAQDGSNPTNSAPKKIEKKQIEIYKFKNAGDSDEKSKDKDVKVYRFESKSDNDAPQEIEVQINGDDVQIKGLEGLEGIKSLKDLENIEETEDGNVRIFRFDNSDPSANKDEIKVITKSCFPKHGSCGDDRPRLGVTLNDSDKGVAIDEVGEGSAAELAGLKEGDLINAIDGQEIKNSSDVVDLIGSKKVGDKIKINYTRNGKTAETEATLKEGKKKEKIFMWHNEDYSDMPPVEPHPFACDELKKMEETPFFGIYMNAGMKSKITVTEVVEGTGAAQANIKSGTTILELNGEKVSSYEEFASKIKGLKVGDAVKVKTEYDGKTDMVKVVLSSRAQAMKQEAEMLKELCENQEMEDAADPILRGEAPDMEMEGNVNISPNPSKGVFNLTYLGEAKPLYVTVVDAKGRQVYYRQFEDFSGELNQEIALPASAAKGIYYVNIYQEGYHYSESVVID